MLPYYRWSLTAGRPIRGYPGQLEHLGHHLLRRRLDLGLQQKQAAEVLGTGAWNLRNWETNRHEIEIRFMPAVIAFLGYDPLPKPRTRGEAVRHARTVRGWSRRKVGRAAGVDEATVRRIEADTPGLARKPLQRVMETLGIANTPRP